MYPLGISALFEGWAKNISKGATQTIWWRLIMIVIYIAALVSVPIEIIESVIGHEPFRILFIIGRLCPFNS